MTERRSRLAARFRKAVQSDEQARQSEQDAARLAAEAARAARDALLTELAEIAREIGVLEVQRGSDGLTLRYRERTLHLAPAASGDVVVEVEGAGDEEHRLFRQPELGDRWVYSRKRRFNREDRVPLFDQGLEDLLVRGLGLPRPGDDEPDEPTGASGRSL